MIDGVTDSNDICNIFSNKYKSILSNGRSMNYELNEKLKNWAILTLSNKDVYEAIKSLKPLLGFDSIHTNHLKLVANECSELLMMLYNSFIMHCFIPIKS